MDSLAPNGLNPARGHGRFPTGFEGVSAGKKAARTRNGWRLAFFEGKPGAQRTGIIDAIAFRLGRKNSELLDVRLVQLKGGNAGVTGKEIARLKQAASGEPRLAG
jgi:hypothetical protein